VKNALNPASHVGDPEYELPIFIATIHVSGRRNNYKIKRNLALKGNGNCARTNFKNTF
jgi:hypothetical protein